MQIPSLEGYGRTIVVCFKCYRCETTAHRLLKDCLPSDGPLRDLYDLEPPAGWRNGGFYYSTFCPDCAKAYDQFMRNETANRTPVAREVTL